MRKASLSNQGAAGDSWLESLPSVQRCRNYQAPRFRTDLLAGLNACVVMVSSVIVYAGLAGLPPTKGLHAALAGAGRPCHFAGSRRVIAGLDAAVTPLVGIGLSLRAVPRAATKPKSKRPAARKRHHSEFSDKR